MLSHKAASVWVPAFAGTTFLRYELLHAPTLGPQRVP
jgi:hypothetical protein